MSAGGIVGLIFNTLAFAALWTIIGVVVDKLAVAFNSTIQILPTMQDAVTGFTLMQTIYSILPGVVFIALLINYFVNENAQSSGEV
jgi:type II secretory pathway component PulF